MPSFVQNAFHRIKTNYMPRSDIIESGKPWSRKTFQIRSHAIASIDVP